MGDLSTLIDRIDALVKRRAEGSPSALLEEMEHTLTDGYAQALAIEGERLRIEREIAVGIAAPEGNGAARLQALSERLAEQERELERLRELLAGLRVRREVVRRDAAGLR